jgi:menaquinone-dependent protoporphyrinogen IX oxidase
MLISNPLIGAALILGASIISSSIIYWHGFSYQSRLAHFMTKYQQHLAKDKLDAFYWRSQNAR